jgi:large conductance mechanosensitive channel
MGFTEDFTAFLEEYGVIGLAIAFVIGQEVNNLVDVIVESAIMPIIGVFLPEGGWQQATATFLGIEFGVGQLLSATINFVVIAFLVFVVVKYLLGKDEVGKIGK